MRTPKLSAQHAIGPALGHYRATPPGGGAFAGPAGGVPLIPMANDPQGGVDLGRCGQGYSECPPGGANYVCCQDGRSLCYQRPDGTWGCVLLMPPEPPPPPRPPTPYSFMPMPLGGAPVSA